MAASITPGEAGMKLEPDILISRWIQENRQRLLLGQTAINYKEFNNTDQGEQQWQQQQ